MNTLTNQILKIETNACLLSLLGVIMWLKHWTELEVQLQTAGEIWTLMMVISERETPLLFPLYHIKKKKEK